MDIRAIERNGTKVKIIDQTKLPGDLIYRDVEDWLDMILAIRRLEVRGAPAIGIAAAYCLAMAAEQTEAYLLDDITRLGNEIKNARPTAVNLFWAIDRLVKKISDQKPDSVKAAIAILWNEAEQIHKEDEIMCRKIGEYGASLIENGDSILTHCNAGALATGGIGTALGVIYVAHEQGKAPKVFADETRPLLQGARLTTWELMQAGVDVTLITDNMAGMVMQHKLVNKVIVGADRIAKNGDFANKIGTYAVAVLAAVHNIPFYVAAPASTFDESMANGGAITIEQRGAEEITEGFGKRIAPEKVKVFTPAFDVTPNDLVTAFITDQGIRPGGRQ